MCLLRRELHSTDGSVARGASPALHPRSISPATVGAATRVHRVTTVGEGLVTNLPGVQSSEVGVLHRLQSDPDGIPHSRYARLRPSGPFGSLQETPSWAANPRRHPTHTSDGTRRESASTRSARDSDLLATLLPVLVANHGDSEGAESPWRGDTGRRKAFGSVGHNRPSRLRSRPSGRVEGMTGPPSESSSGQSSCSSDRGKRNVNDVFTRFCPIRTNDAVLPLSFPPWIGGARGALPSTDAMDVCFRRPPVTSK